ncbi:Lipase, GDSL [Cynara cardunculus var. scolymus]|uniref:Lipase, GDSL n=1 Tax=Cynara cardunculus var. scolymus TaxID=59895 RepID=A0A124SFD9_CYNCS|nr:Lipase, GDSL [Cynara cardunculus var. scolymus]
MDRVEFSAMKVGNTIVFLCAVMVTTMMKITMGKGIYGALFIFGDSILDVGTNNHFNDSTARADHQYYGVDYPDSVATGRFSNGYNSADLLARYIADYTYSPPPFLSLVDRSGATFLQEILEGANFASAGSGILIDTGHEKYAREQIQQFSTIRGNISESLGKSAANIFLAMSTYIISVGSNDFFEHQHALSLNQTEPEQLIANLTATYSIHLQSLYDLGARKFALIGIPPLGCCPIERFINLTLLQGDGGCVMAMNDLAQAFHASTESLLQNFSSTNQGVVYSLGNTYNTILNFIDNPRANGFRVVETACCGNGTFNAEKKCERGSKLCVNRDEYLFWDEFHPTQAASRQAALTLAYAEGPEFVTPMNFSSLANVFTYP